MLRTTTLMLLCASALHAQSSLSPTPIPSTVRDGGTLDWATGTWTRSNASFANAIGNDIVFENSCNYSGGPSYAPTGDCWERYEEGRLPTGDPADPFTSTPGLDPGQVCDCYFLCGFRFGYCSNEDLSGGGNVQIQIGFLEGPDASGIGGACMNFAGLLSTPIPPSGAPTGLGLPPANLGGARDLFFDITGLPGGNATNADCWLITIDLSNNPNGGFSFCGDGGDASFDNDGTDLFNRVWSQRGTTELGLTPTGPIVAGDFQVSAGAGALGVPSGVDPWDGSGCGTGLDITDGTWINVDGQPVGATGVNGCTSGGGSPAMGSGCYTLGGWPQNPVADSFLTLWSSGCDNSKCHDCGPPPPTPYCSAKASSSGCLAQLGGSQPGAPVSGANDWSIVLSGAEAGRPGIFFVSISGQAALPFQGGTLCVQPPTKRSAIEFTFGTQGFCDGAFSLLINDGSLIPTGFDAGPGNFSFMQAWYREPALMDGFDTALSSALQITWQ